MSDTSRHIRHFQTVRQIVMLLMIPHHPQPIPIAFAGHWLLPAANCSQELHWHTRCLLFPCGGLAVPTLTKLSSLLLAIGYLFLTSHSLTTACHRLFQKIVLVYSVVFPHASLLLTKGLACFTKVLSLPLVAGYLLLTSHLLLITTFYQSFQTIALANTSPAVPTWRPPTAYQGSGALHKGIVSPARHWLLFTDIPLVTDHRLLPIIPENRATKYIACCSHMEASLSSHSPRVWCTSCTTPPAQQGSTP